MSCAAHQAEINKDASRRQLDALVLSFSGLRCPFCGDADLFVHAPGTRHWSGKRTWWTVGCDSRKCNSCWTLNEDTYERVMSKIQYAQNAEVWDGGAQAGTREKTSTPFPAPSCYRSSELPMNSNHTNE